jgi:mannitol/fructose-specific phosphotransferase system IIA component (Ntr-type)
VGNAVLERESHISTGLGSGVAIPHAKVKGLKETSRRVWALFRRN